MRGQDQWLAGGQPEEFGEGGANVGIGQVERLVGVLALQQEGSIGGLAIARRVDIASAAKGAGLALNEQAGAKLGVAARRQRCVPAVALKVRRRMDIEDRGLTLPRRDPVRQPFRGTVEDRWGREPTIRESIVGSASGFGRVEMPPRSRLAEQHVTAPFVDGERAGDDEQDQEEDDSEEAASTHCGRP